MASGVVKRFDNVMISLWGSLFAFLACEEPFAAGAAGLVDDDDRLLG